MGIRKTAVAAIVAFSMVAVPTVVQAAQANQTVSKVAVARVGASSTVKANELRGGSIIIALLAAAAVIGGIIIAADGKKSPRSP
jgi:uncharacterized Zn-binding protein involved in type VI secretion